MTARLLRASRRGACASCGGRRPKRGLPGGSVSHPWLTRRARPPCGALRGVAFAASARKGGSSFSGHSRASRIHERKSLSGSFIGFRKPGMTAKKQPKRGHSHTKAAGLSGVCTERAERWRDRRRGSGRAPGNVRARVNARARLWERSGRPGGGAYPRQSGGPGMKRELLLHRYISSQVTGSPPSRG